MSTPGPPADRVPGGDPTDGADQPDRGGSSERVEGGERKAGEAAARRDRAVRGTLAAGLILEGVTVLFVPLAVARVSEDGLGAAALTLLLLLAAALFVTAGLQKRRAGLIAATTLQLAVIATGLIIPAMYFLGLLFAGVWAYLLWVRQEVARAAARTAPG